MNKRIFICITLLLIFVLVFSACNQNTTTTSVKIRWDDEESGSYTVSLSDFANGTEASGSVFKSYTVENDSTTYYKDRMMSNEVAFSGRDEIVPAMLKGTFTYNIKNDGVSRCTVTTEQVLYSVYAKTDVKDEQAMKSAQAAEEEIKAQFGEVPSNVVVYKSVTKTSVTFFTTESSGVKRNQVPEKSSTSIKGFYIGKTHQSVSDSTVSTVYDIAAGTAKVTLNGKETERKLDVPSSGNFIDANQLWLYVRSLEKHSDNFADAPTVTVYDPATDTKVAASFAFTYSSPTVISHVLSDGTEKQYYVKLSSVAIYLGGSSYMFTQSYPDKLAEQKDLDCLNTGFGTVSKYTISRFRVGYRSYQLNDQSASLLSDLEDVSKK